MEWLEIFRLPQPLTTGEAFFTMWFIGFVGGYCFGRAHAAWKTLNKFIKDNTRYVK